MKGIGSMEHHRPIHRYCTVVPSNTYSPTSRSFVILSNIMTTLSFHTEAMYILTLKVLVTTIDAQWEGM